MNSQVDVITHANIREIRMARPPANALDPELCRQLIAAIEAAHADDVHGLVLSGGERIFSAGLDLPCLLALGMDKAAINDAWQAFFGVARALATARMPVAAAITGHSPAGGCVLALCCDYRVMARSADAARPFTIGLNEVQVGLVAPEGIQQLLRRVVGVHRAERLLVAGSLVPAEHAFEIGLVDELADAGEVAARAIAWLQALLQLPRSAMLQTRAIARAELGNALDHANIRLDRFVEAWYAPEAQAALQAALARLKK